MGSKKLTRRKRLQKPRKAGLARLVRARFLCADAILNGDNHRFVSIANISGKLLQLLSTWLRLVSLSRMPKPTSRQFNYVFPYVL